MFQEGSLIWVQVEYVHKQDPTTPAVKSAQATRSRLQELGPTLNPSRPVKNKNLVTFPGGESLSLSHRSPPWTLGTKQTLESSQELHVGPNCSRKSDLERRLEI